MGANKIYINNCPDEVGTQLLLSHSLSPGQRAALEKFNVDYSEDGPDDGVFINVEKAHVNGVEFLLQKWGYV